MILNKIQKIFLLGIILFFLQVYAISSGANEPIADNELGLTAKDCALQYCEEKDGMALWLTLVNECVGSPNPYFTEKNTGQNQHTQINQVNQLLGVSPIIAGSICAMVGVIGLLFGYVVGTYENTKTYIQLDQDENYELK
jgi:hypothetical protein